MLVEQDETEEVVSAFLKNDERFAQVWLLVKSSFVAAWGEVLERGLIVTALTAFSSRRLGVKIVSYLKWVS